METTVADMKTNARKAQKMFNHDYFFGVNTLS